jgi:hypothetical protein
MSKLQYSFLSKSIKTYLPCAVFHSKNILHKLMLNLIIAHQKRTVKKLSMNFTLIDDGGVFICYITTRPAASVQPRHSPTRWPMTAKTFDTII